MLLYGASITFITDDIVSHPDALFPASLVFENSSCLFLAAVIALHEPFYLQPFTRVNHQDPVDPILQAFFDQ